MPINVFGAGAVQTAYVSYESYILSSDLVLFWPSSYQDSPNLSSAFMNFTSVTAINLTVTLPDATQVSVGQNIIIANTSANAFMLLDNGGNNIGTIRPGFMYYYILSDNTTAPGQWVRQTFGAGNADIDAVELAGLGLVATSGKLNTNIPVISTVGPNYTVTAANNASLIIWSGGAGNITLPAVSTVPDGFYFSFNNEGSGQVGIAGDGLIDGNTPFNVGLSQSLTLVKSGLSWWTIGFGQQTFLAVNVLNKNVSGNTNVTLSTAEAQRNIQQYNGVLTGNITVYFPVISNEWTIYNGTTGPYTLTVQLAGPTGTSYIIPQSNSQIFYSDMTTLRITPSVLTPSAITFPSGTATAPGIAFSSDPTTGIYQSFNGHINLTTSGISGFDLTSSQATFSKPTAFPEGTQSAPSISFNSDLQSGIYQTTVARVDISAGGTHTINVTPTAINMLVPAAGTSMSLNGTLGVLGATTLAGLTANATTLDSLTVTNNANIDANLGVLGDANIDGTLGVLGATTLAGLTAGATTLASANITANATAGSLTVTGASGLAGLSASGVASFSSGTNLAPSITFTADVKTGIYQSGIGSLDITANQTRTITFSSTGITTYVPVSLGGATFSGPIQEIQGSATTPSYTFTADATSGIYQSASGHIDLTAGGTHVLGSTNVLMTGYVPVQLASTLGVLGATTLAGLTAGATGVGALTANSAIVSTTLGVTGATALNSTLSVTGISTFNSRLLIPNGTTSAPSIGFIGDTSTGLLQDTPGEIIFVVGGAITSKIYNNDTLLYTPISFTNNGSATNPMLAFFDDSNSGIYQSASGNIDLTAGGTHVLGSTNVLMTGYVPVQLASTLGVTGATTLAGLSAGTTSLGALTANSAIVSTTLGVTGISTFTGVIKNAAGTAAAPSVTFTADATSGMYQPASGQVALSAGGVEVVGATSTAVTLYQDTYFPDGTALLPSISFTADTSVGMYRIGADSLGFSVNSTQTLAINTTNITASQPIYHTAGSVSAPSITFTGNSTSGMYQSATGNIDLAAGGTHVLGSTSALITAYVPIIGTSLTLGTPLAIASGGTNANTAAQAIINLMPSAVSGNVPYFNGTNWVNLAPSSTANRSLTMASNVPAWNGVSTLQVVSLVNNTSSTQATSTTFTAVTGLTSSITLATATSRVMVQTTFTGSAIVGGGANTRLALYRGATQLAIFVPLYNASAATCQGYTFTYLDSPATSGSNTYSINVATTANAGTLYINRDSGNTLNGFTSNLILSEISA